MFVGEIFDGGHLYQAPYTIPSSSHGSNIIFFFLCSTIIVDAPKCVIFILFYFYLIDLIILKASANLMPTVLPLNLPIDITLSKDLGCVNCLISPL